jgi:hypothetical protein
MFMKGASFFCPVAFMLHSFPLCACTMIPTIFPCSTVAIIVWITTSMSTSSATLIVVIVTTSTEVDFQHHLLHHLLHLSHGSSFARLNGVLHVGKNRFRDREQVREPEPELEEEVQTVAHTCRHKHVHDELDFP